MTDKKTMCLDVTKGEITDISVGDKVVITVKGTVQRVDGGKKKDPKDEHDYSYPPSLELKDVTSEVELASNAFTEIAEDEERS